MNKYCIDGNNTNISMSEFIDIRLQSGNIVKVKRTDWLTLNKIGEELILFSLELGKKSKLKQFCKTGKGCVECDFTGYKSIYGNIIRCDCCNNQK